MDETTWAALAAVLTVLGVVWTFVAFRRRGAPNGLRALGFTLLPAAAWLTGTLRMFSEIGLSVSRWASSLVLNPMVWTGVGLAGLSVVLFVVSGYLRDRQLARGARTRELPADRPSGPGGRSQGQPSVGDDELDEIEELLRKRGIR